MKTTVAKEPYLKILNVQGNIYEEFLPDQVLTHNNLNKVINYFEDQDRRSRIYLHGVGISCGLNITEVTENKIQIGQGCGITTDGDLIKANTSEFLYYTDLFDRGNYSLLENLKVFEIHTQEGAGHQNGELPLSLFKANVGFALKDCMLIAYVEGFTEDEGLCNDFGCDETGNKVYSNVKFLLTHKDNYEKLIENDTIYNRHNVLKYYKDLPELHPKRLLLNKANTTLWQDIHNQFKQNEPLVKELEDAILLLLDNYSNRINFQKFGITSSNIQQEFSTLFQKPIPSTYNDIQYQYDHFNDLIATYHQIRELVLYTHFECVPNHKAFPKHLLLGSLDESTRLETRHKFYPSPITTLNDENLMKFRSLFIKFYYQLKNYAILEPKSAQIKVTPSKSYEFLLTERSIPYYYSNTNTLLTNWNLNNTIHHNSQLGYRIETNDYLKHPLKYNHKDKDFYRIEGHLGKNYVTALKKITSIKIENNLAFDVKTVSIGFPVSNINFDDVKCETENISRLLESYQKEFLCTADAAINFLGSYLFNKPGEVAPIAKKANKLTIGYAVDYAYKNYPYLSVGTIDIDTSRTRVSNSSTVTTTPQPRLRSGVSNTPGGRSARFESASADNFNTIRSLGSTISSEESEMIPYYDFTAESMHTSRAYAAEVLRVYNPDTVESRALKYIKENSEKEFEPAIEALYIVRPVNIIVKLQEVKQQFIKTINDFYVTQKLSAFNIAIDELCREVKALILNLTAWVENDVYGKQKNDKLYEYHINQVYEQCCIKKKMIWIKEQLDDIRNNLYKELILSNFIEKHPGLEHMAGVPKGGTFIMVYLGQHESKNERQMPFSGTVLFDFALPYQCVADCAPETIVYQDVTQPKEVTIAKQIFCFIEGEDVASEPFKITPSGGLLTSPQGNEFIVGKPDDYVFDPKLVPDNLLGKSIQFAIDDNAVQNIEIKVYKLPKTVSINYDNVKWFDRQLAFDMKAVTGTVSHQSYFLYNWSNKNTTWKDVSTRPNGLLRKTFDVTGDKYKDELVLSISVNDLTNSCSTKPVNVTVKETRPDELQLDCRMGVKTRLEKLEFDPIIENIKSKILGQPFESLYNDGVIIRLQKLLERIEQASEGVPTTTMPDSLIDPKFLDELIKEITTRRKAILSEMIKPGDFPDFMPVFLDTDELFELVGLELMRCLNEDITAKISNVSANFFATSKDFIAVREQLNYKHIKINAHYIERFKAGATDVDMLFDSVYNQLIS